MILYNARGWQADFSFGNHVVALAFTDEQNDFLIDVVSMLAFHTLLGVYGLMLRHICLEHINYHFDFAEANRLLSRKLAERFEVIQSP